MATLEQLIEQAEFLLQQHQQAHVACSKDFGGLLQYLQEKMHQEADEESAGILVTVYETLKNQGEELNKTMIEDIEFLQAQVKAFKEVQSVQDPVRKKELTDLLLEDAGEIQATEEFKKEVLADAEENRKSLADMIFDIRQAVEEGGVAELEALFDAMKEEEEELEAGECCASGCEQDPTDLENSCCGDDSFDEEDEEEEEDDAELEIESRSVNIFEHLEKAEALKKENSACCGNKGSCGSDCVCDDSSPCA